MALYTAESIERVKDAVDMVELVGARTDLRRVGARFTGLCPFHDERTPSFSVNAEHGLYHCFGCGASGDAIRFVQETEALDFKGAIELLADRYGVELQREQEDPREEERRRRSERLLKLVDRTADFYARYLWESEEAARAREYLAARGLSEEVLRTFRVGYAPKAWDRIVLAAQRDGYDVQEIAAAGLGQRGRQGGFYDRFRGRIMFPLADRRGRVRGFGARALRDDQKPKYLNTSENELFEKGRQLFGLDRARAPAASAGRVVIVEGYTDVLTLHQAGITEAVAIMGTALTQQQIAELPFLAKTVYLALDADRAGQEAMLRAARGASRHSPNWPIEP
jgi:DNA primase